VSGREGTRRDDGDDYDYDYDDYDDDDDDDDDGEGLPTFVRSRGWLNNGLPYST
jgi:hypothetical protein